MRTEAQRFSDILEAIAKIGEKLPSGEEAFQRDEMLQVWVIHHLQRIGEAARALSPELRTQHPEVPWAQIVALRNILIHEYFGLNLSQVWQMVASDLPRLKEQIEAILAEPPSTSTPG